MQASLITSCVASALVIVLQMAAEGVTQEFLAALESEENAAANTKETSSGETTGGTSERAQD